MRKIVCFHLANIGGVVLLLQSCATTTHKLSETGQVGGAQGEASIDYGNEFGKVALDVEVNHLPPPGQAVPDSTLYVVWVRPTQSLPNEPVKEGFPITNVGALRLEADAKGELKTKIAPFYSNFEVFVTAERYGGADAPTTPPVFWAHFTLTG